jgi:hypothetical protein
MFVSLEETHGIKHHNLHGTIHINLQFIKHQKPKPKTHKNTNTKTKQSQIHTTQTLEIKK